MDNVKNLFSQHAVLFTVNLHNRTLNPKMWYLCIIYKSGKTYFK